MAVLNHHIVASRDQEDTARGGTEARHPHPLVARTIGASNHPTDIH